MSRFDAMLRRVQKLEAQVKPQELRRLPVRFLSDDGTVLVSTPAPFGVQPKVYIDLDPDEDGSEP